MIKRIGSDFESKGIVLDEGHNGKLMSPNAWRSGFTVSLVHGNDKNSSVTLHAYEIEMDNGPFFHSRHFFNTN